MCRRLGAVAQTVLPGTVVVPPQQLLVVAAPAAGLIEAVLVAQNESVREGQPIARLRSTDLLEAQRTYLQALAADQLAQTRLSATNSCRGSASSPNGG